MSFYITKASGEKELFDIKKFRRSLKRAGASPSLIKQLAHEIEKKKKLRSTKEIYDFALKQLSKRNTPVASRYNIKRALFELGPAGMPFEQFVARLFKEKGYSVKTNQIVSGHCVNHEVDVFAQQDKKQFMIECKFHNSHGPKTDVVTTLYVQARFEDIDQAWQKKNPGKHKFHKVWVVTNTKFTSEAVKYGECQKMNLLGWSYPRKENLQKLIDKLGLQPITTLVSLKKQQKRTLIDNGIILCSEAKDNMLLIKKVLRFTPQQVKKFVAECEKVCEMGCIENGNSVPRRRKEK